MSDKKQPTHEEIQKEFEDFVKNRFGDQVQVVAQSVPFQEDMPQDDNTDVEEKESFDLNFDLKPKEVKSYLDRFVIKQDEAKKALSIAVCDHYNQVISHHLKAEDEKSNDTYAKQNVLILGPTGVGKTYMIRQIAKLIGVPFVRADATRFSETGYMGANVDDLVRDLVQQAEGNVELAQYGIVYLDEADKIASSGRSHGREVNARGVQLALLKLMEETEVDLKSGNDPASQMQALMDFQKTGKSEKQLINTRHILFIVSGAFSGLADIIGKRLNKRAIGFKHEDKKEHTEEELLDQASTQDFIDFGFEAEFIGRLPIRVACKHLKNEDLYKILKNSEGSIIHQYIESFKAYDIDVHFTDSALKKIAELASYEKTGARALMTVCEKILRDHKFELPSLNIRKLAINKDLVENPEKELKKIIRSHSAQKSKPMTLKVREYEKYFLKSFNMKISFDKEAILFISELSRKQRKTVKEILDEVLKSYEHGLKLIQQNTGQKEFVLGKDVIFSPKSALEGLISQSYKTKKHEEK